MLTRISNSIIYTREMSKFHHNKACENAMVDKFELTSYKYFIKIVGYTSLGNGWIAILIIRRVGAMY